MSGIDRRKYIKDTVPLARISVKVPERCGVTREWCTSNCTINPCGAGWLLVSESDAPFGKKFADDLRSSLRKFNQRHYVDVSGYVAGLSGFDAWRWIDRGYDVLPEEIDSFVDHVMRVIRLHYRLRLYGDSHKMSA